VRRPYQDTHSKAIAIFLQCSNLLKTVERRTMPFVQLPTGSIYYTEHGQGHPIVLLHANPGDSQDFEAVIPALAKNYRVLAIDWLGYGQSTIPAHPQTANVRLYDQVLREFLSALALPPACFIGNSIGGNVAARLAIKSSEQVRGLVLVAPGGFSSMNFITRIFCRLQGSRFSLPPRFMAEMYLKCRTAVVEAMLQRAATVQTTTERIALNRAMWRSFARPESGLHQTAHNITVPTLLMFGQYDPIISADKDGKIAAQRISNAQFVVLPCGHVSFAELPELFLEVVEPFLSKLYDF
jgi:pimeloyl-ACP methyl ester carboxylesterase